MKQFRVEMLRILLLLFVAYGGGLSVIAQVDTVLLRVWGGIEDERGAQLTPLQDGGMLLTGTTNSTSDQVSHAWLVRLDSFANPIWKRSISDAPLLQGVDAVELSDGSLTVLGMRYGSAAVGYDWGWYDVSEDGVIGSSSSWGTDSWDLPVWLGLRNDTMWTLGSTYASGNGDIQWVQHVRQSNAWLLDDEAVLASSPEEESVEDAIWHGDTLVVWRTCSPGSTSVARATAIKPSTGEVFWEFTSEWDFETKAVALDGGPQGLIGLMNVATDEGSRLAFVHLDWDGTVLLSHVPGSGVDVEARDVVWYSPSDFATTSWTEQLGLGGEEVLFSRWSTSGAWQGGPSFGSPWNDAVEDMERDAAGRIWMLGRSDGYFNGRDDFYLLQLPHEGVGGYVLDDSVHVEDTVLEVFDFLIGSDIQLAPNPATDRTRLLGALAQDIWRISDQSGRVVRVGRGSEVNLLGLKPGVHTVSVLREGEALDTWSLLIVR